MFIHFLNWLTLKDRTFLVNIYRISRGNKQADVG